MTITDGYIDYSVAQIGLEYHVICRLRSAKPKSVWQQYKALTPTTDRAAAYRQLEAHINAQKMTAEAVKEMITDKVPQIGVDCK